MGTRARPILTLTLLLAAAAPAVAQEEPPEEEEPAPRPPPSGLPFIIPGAILTGTGPLTMLISAFYCPTIAALNDLNNVFQPKATSSSDTACFAVLLSVGGVEFVTGVTLLVIGAGQRARYNEWKHDHPLVKHLSFLPAKGGGGLSYQLTF